MYAIKENNHWVVFASLNEAEDYRENLYNKGVIDSLDELEIVPYHWTMG